MARFYIFHALSFELNFFFDRRCSLTCVGKVQCCPESKVIPCSMT